MKLDITFLIKKSQRKSKEDYNLKINKVLVSTLMINPNLMITKMYGILFAKGTTK